MKDIYRWIILKDHICDGEDTGVVGPRHADMALKDNKATFKMFDDDKELYYEGELFGCWTGFEPLDDFGMPNAGCTMISINGEML